MSHSDTQSSPPQSRARTNSKLKVLGRSHAMREETSPPRDPACTTSPTIQLIPSEHSSPNQCLSPTLCKPLVVLSPSLSRGNSPSRRSSFDSSTSTIALSPKYRSLSQSSFSNNCESLDISKLHVVNQQVNLVEGACTNSIRCIDSNRHSCQESWLHCEGGFSKCDEVTQTKDCRKNVKNEKMNCECPKIECSECIKNRRRNFNNNINSYNNDVNGSNSLSVHKSVRGKLRQQSSSQGSYDGSSSTSTCLSRDNSTELQYTDTSGTHLEHFIAETLNRNSKDRAFMLRIETELVNLATDKMRTHLKFPPMSSYQRMCIHRVSAYFGMEHNIDSSGKCVVVNKSANTRVPETPFRNYLRSDISYSEEPQRSILKRDSNSVEDYNFKSPERQSLLENRKSKSFEEREEEYEKVRRRIFSREMHAFNSAEEFGWSEIPWSSSESESCSRLRLLHPEKNTGRLLKVQSVETKGDLPRPCVAKSYSFGGYGGVSVLTRGDSVLSTHSAGPRLLTKQDSGASNVSWRLSPSSSGYKSQSLISESITPSPTSTPNPSGESNRQDSVGSSLCTNTSESSNIPHEKQTSETQLMWAVSDIHNIPRGSVIINPQTGEPLKNIDGSIYHYDPSNPPDINGSFKTEKCVAEKSDITSNVTSEKIKKDDHLSSNNAQLKSPPTHNKRLTLINSSTSPSLPYTPPVQQNYTATFSSNPEAVSNFSMQQYQPTFGNNYNNIPTQESLPVYQQPCLMYTPYGVPTSIHCDGRLEQQIQEPPANYFMAESSNAPIPSNYQPTLPFWNQQSMYMYPNQQTNTSAQLHQSHQRFTVPMPSQPGSFIQPHFPSTSPSLQNLPPPPPPPPQHSGDPLSMFPPQPVQLVYSTPNPSNTVVYPNQGLLYSQNPMYPGLIVPVQNIPQNVPYPTSAGTPGSCAQIPNTYCSQVMEHQTSFGQLNNSMGQLMINSNLPAINQANQNIPCVQSIPIPHAEMRGRRSSTPKSNKFFSSKCMVSNSSQSSTGTNSPATTVVAGFCVNQRVFQYRTPPATPPTPNNSVGYSQSLMQPMVVKPLGNICVGASVNRNSRSPTPASDSSQIEHRRFSFPPSTTLQGLPCIVQSDSRLLPVRGTNLPRPAFSRQQSQNTDNVNKHKKKFRGNKNTGLPPTGK